MTYAFTGFTPRANAALNSAFALAGARGHTYVGSEHLLLSLTSDPGGVAGAVLRNAGLSAETLSACLEKRMGKGIPTVLTPEDVTPRLQKIVASALALSEGDASLAGTDHLLLSLLQERHGAAFRLLADAGVSPGALQSSLTSAMRSGSVGVKSGPEKKTGKALDVYGTDLTALARAGRLDPVVGRETELTRVTRILSRRTKNNPCLVGDPGVGKTAVVLGLALSIAEGKVPPALAGKRLISLDLNAMVAGAKYRGDFESRLGDVMRETADAGDVILFIDEVHNLMGAGAAEGAVDAANILKPALAAGRLRLIGATTADEYYKTVAKDKALSRRFQTVPVPESTPEETLEILRGLSSVYAAHHGVTYTDDALAAAVELSVRFLPERFLPDKAIDLMDEAGAAAGEGAVIAAPEIKKAAAVVSGTPVEAVLSGHRARLRDLERTLGQAVLGQEAAVKTVADAVRRAGAGLGAPGRPMGTFLFCGPSGVGKTLLAKTLAKEVFGDEKAIIVTDLSAYGEAHDASSLFGAPPGYVGYDEGESLVRRLRKKPYAVLLFDEIEKAHPDVLPGLMRLMDEGVLAGKNGEEANAGHTIIIYTSNLAASPVSAAGFLSGEGEGRERALYGFFRPEFLGRIDEIVFFRPLDAAALSGVARKMLAPLFTRTQKQGVRLEMDPEVPSLLGELAGREKKGARPLRGLIARMVASPLAELLLRDPPPETVRLAAEDGKVRVSAES